MSDVLTGDVVSADEAPVEAEAKPETLTLPYEDVRALYFFAALSGSLLSGQFTFEAANMAALLARLGPGELTTALENTKPLLAMPPANEAQIKMMEQLKGI